MVEWVLLRWISSAYSPTNCAEWDDEIEFNELPISVPLSFFPYNQPFSWAILAASGPIFRIQLSQNSRHVIADGSV